MKDLKKIAAQRRADAVTMIANAGAGHTGGAMSCLDILTCLYYDVMHIDANNPDDPDRDRFVLSKGHCVEGLYAILADLGFIKKEELSTFSKGGTRLIGHPNNKVEGIEVCSGALGHGLSIGVGMALGAKRTHRGYRTYVVMGDGEQAEGSIYEAAMSAAHYKLDNLYAIIDRNGLQISGSTEEVMALDSIKEKWEAFGWHVVEFDGHDIPQILLALEERPCIADELVELTQIPARRVLSSLTILQVGGYVTQEAGKRFRAQVKLKME